MALLSPQQRRRRRILQLIAGIIAVFFLQYLWSRISSPWRAVKIMSTTTADAPAAPRELRILAYNIAHGRGLAAGNWSGGDEEAREQRLVEIGRLIKAQHPDIVVLNEVDFDSTWSKGVNQAETLAHESGIINRSEQRNIDAAIPFLSFAFGNALLSRFPILDAEVVDFPAYSTFESMAAGRKKGLLCTLQLSSEKKLRVLAVHLEHRSENVRIAAARTIEELRKASDLPLIAAGDFNSSPVNYPAASLGPEGGTALSSLLAGGGFITALKKQLTASDFTFPSDKPDRAIDWVLVPSDWKILEHRPIESQLSDHRPVLARIQLP